MTLETSPRRAALVAGSGYLVIFVLAIFANFFVVDGLVEPGDAAATVTNIRESEGLFRSGLVAFTIVFVLDVVIAWALYVLFRNVNKAAQRLLGGLLVLAGAAYVVDTLANAMLANYQDYADLFLVIVALPAVVGELSFTIWLLRHGGKAQAPPARSL